MKQKQVLLQKQEPTLIQSKWDRKLGSKFALAPRDMQREGINDVSYGSYNEHFDTFCSQYVEEALRNMILELGPGEIEDSVVTVLGPGLARGLKFIPFANSLGMKAELCDVSEKAIENADKALEEMGVWSTNSTFLQEIEGRDEDVSQDTKLIVMSQFLQILPSDKMDAIMKMVGRRMLSNNCRAVIVHPFNNPGAEWGDTIPYSLPELLKPLKEVTGPLVRVCHEKTVRYFDRHNYTAFTLVYSGGT